MFYYLEGPVAYILPNAVVLDCGGVGYHLTVSNNTLTRAKIGEELRLFTHLYVREDAVELFGFADLKEKNSFLMLIDISGVGPKAAMAILSVTTPDRFAVGIMSGDEKMLMRAQGVGKKLAQRILLELKDKLAPSQLELSGAQMDASPVHGSKSAEASAALASLGYSQQEIASALKGVDVNAMSVEQIVRHALRAMVMQ